MPASSLCAIVFQLRALGSAGVRLIQRKRSKASGEWVERPVRMFLQVCLFAVVCPPFFIYRMGRARAKPVKMFLAGRRSRP